MYIGHFCKKNDFFLHFPGLATILKKMALPKVPIFRCPKMGLRTAESKNGDHFFTPTPPKMVDLTFVSCVYHFWMKNNQILNFAYFYLIFPWARAIFFKIVAKPGKCKKNHFFYRNGLYTCWYKIYLEAMRFWKLFGILVHPSTDTVSFFHTFCSVWQYLSCSVALCVWLYIAFCASRQFGFASIYHDTSEHH